MNEVVGWLVEDGDASMSDTISRPISVRYITYSRKDRLKHEDEVFQRDTAMEHCR